AGDEPGRLPGRQGHAADRRLGAQPGVEGERVRLEGGAGNVDRGGRRVAFASQEGEQSHEWRRLMSGAVFWGPVERWRHLPATTRFLARSSLRSHRGPGKS